MGAGTIGKQPQLLLLDAILAPRAGFALHISSGAIDFVIECLLVAGKVGDNESRIAPLIGDLQLGNHLAAPLPGAGRIVKLEEFLLFLTRALGQFLHPSHGLTNTPQQGLILGDSHDVSHSVTLTPGEHVMTAEAGIVRENNAHFGPDFEQSFHLQRQDRPGMLGRIDLAGPQIAHQ
jgi:hypothetical protein